MSEESRVFFLLYHHNEIDHRVPIIYKWAETSDIPADVVLLSNPNLLSDYRIEFLKQYDDLNIYHVDSLVEASDDSSGSMLERAVSTAIVSAESVGRRLPDQLPKNKIWSLVGGEGASAEYKSRKLFDRIDSCENAVLAVDWTINPITQQLINRFGDRFSTVCLPHGDSPFFNAFYNQKMVQNALEPVNDNVCAPTEYKRLAEQPYGPAVTELLFSHSYKEYRKYRMFDAIVTPNEITAKRWRPFVDDSALHVLGSPRYNDEWLGVNASIAPTSPDLSVDGDVLKLVVFLRNPRYFVSPKMINTTIKFLSAIDQVFIVAKEHPSGRMLSNSSGTIEDLDNVLVIDESVSSTALLEWGDVFLDVGSSIVFEAVKHRKPVLALEFLHSYHTTLAHYIPETTVQSLDELYHKLSIILERDEVNYYSKSNIEKFLDQMVNPTGNNVLSDYVRLLLKELNHSKWQ